jgi:hypothetical protein
VQIALAAHGAGTIPHELLVHDMWGSGPVMFAMI